MKIYADDRSLRLRQAAGDAAALTVSAVTAAVAWTLRSAILELSSVGEQLQRSGSGVTGGAARAEERLRDLPAIGETLAAPFGTIADAGAGITSAGDQLNEAISTAAVVLPMFLVVPVLAVVLLAYLPRRLRWVREAAEVRRLLMSPAAAVLLSHRAVANRSLRQLRRASPDPARALVERRWSELATLELRALGLDPARLARPDVVTSDAPDPPQ